MSYGSMIATPRPAPHLEKSRRCKFRQVHQSAQFVFYARTESQGALTERQAGRHVLGSEGYALLLDLASPFYFLDFLLLNQCGEVDVAKNMQRRIDQEQFLRLPLAQALVFELNQVYLLHGEPRP